MASKSSHVPSSGLSASCPPSSAPIAHGEPTSPAPCSSALFRPLRFVRADRVHRRQVDDVEAELGELAAAPPRRRGSPPNERGKSSYHEPNRASSRSTSTSNVARHRPRRGGRPRRRRGPPRRVSESRAEEHGALRRARPRGPCWPASDLAPELVLPGRDAVGPRGDRELPAPGRSTVNAPPKRSLPSGSERLLAPPPRRRGRARGPRRRACRGRP